MSLLGGWLLAPLVLTLLCCGLGMLAERASGARLPGALVPVVGLAALIVVSALCVLSDATAKLAAPSVAMLAVAGFVLGRPWSDERLRAAWPWAVALAVAGFAVYAAPSLLSGQASIAGYVRLDDSAIWLATVDRALEHGRSLDGVPPGSYQRTLQYWLAAGYPLGGLLPLGVTARLSGQDAANVYQPAISVLAAILALGLSACLRPLVSSRALVAGASLLAVMASQLMAYTQWGGMKEICAAALLGPLAWLAVRGGRALALLALVAGAVCTTVGLSGMGWAGPAIAIGALAALRGRPSMGQALRAAALLGAGLLVVALPAVMTLDFLDQVRHGAISSQSEFGNLVRAPRLLQGAGLWPIGDVRLDPDPLWLAVVLSLTCVAATLGSIALAVRRGAWQIPALVVVALIGCAGAVIIGSPWIDAKALAILAPMILLAAAGLAAALLEQPDGAGRLLGIGLAVLLVGGCAWSLAAVVNEVRVAPRDRFAELHDLGKAIAGRGPTVQLDYDVYGDRWFLRDAAPDGATDLRQRHVRGPDGQDFPEQSTVEVDDINPSDLWAYTIIVRRLSPLASRPPSAFRRIFAGSSWEAWERPADAPVPVRLRSASARGLPTAHIPCERIAGLSRLGAPMLAAVVRPQAPLLTNIATARIPRSWRDAGLRPVDDGDATIRLQVPAGGRWRAWVQTSSLGSLEVRIDDRSLGTLRHETSHAGQWLRYGAADLTAGAHVLRLRYRRGALWRGGRGTSDAQLPLGAIALTPSDADSELAVTRVPAADYRKLCGGPPLDWVEAIGVPPGG